VCLRFWAVSKEDLAAKTNQPRCSGAAISLIPRALFPLPLVGLEVSASRNEGLKAAQSHGSVQHRQKLDTYNDHTASTKAEINSHIETVTGLVPRMIVPAGRPRTKARVGHVE